MLAKWNLLQFVADFHFEFIKKYVSIRSFVKDERSKQLNNIYIICCSFLFTFPHLIMICLLNFWRCWITISSRPIIRKVLEILVFVISRGMVQRITVQLLQFYFICMKVNNIHRIAKKNIVIISLVLFLNNHNKNMLDIFRYGCNNFCLTCSV